MSQDTGAGDLVLLDQVEWRVSCDRVTVLCMHNMSI